MLLCLLKNNDRNILCFLFHFRYKYLVCFQWNFIKKMYAFLFCVHCMYHYWLKKNYWKELITQIVTRLLMLRIWAICRDVDGTNWVYKEGSVDRNLRSGMFVPLLNIKFPKRIGSNRSFLGNIIYFRLYNSELMHRREKQVKNFIKGLYGFWKKLKIFVLEIR
jgi:hypothetical protein